MTRTQMIRIIRGIEAAAYPPEMRMMQHARRWRDVEDYCESRQVDVWLASDGQAYCIACRDTREIVDLAAARPMRLAELLQVAAWLGAGTWTADLRAATSGRLLRGAARLGWITLRERGTWRWDGHEMVDVDIEIP